ncbi:hypothetical protein [Dyadobacter sp. CY323]|uniref:hypothetical protein n=1 Tax=Dyadobacter sp. CY323 TaxID=2907302 RepID=UPI001F37320B|nr:hypothetical protein [Dyadobacter sp. CY323]MCE6991940.1 hypothetical protein [Dyadobacter sp. CY323]
MKKAMHVVMGVTLAAHIFSCDPPKDSIIPDPQEIPGTVSGAVTPVGAVYGEAVTAKIGPAGGIISSTDQRIRVSIPAGALSAEQTISIQSLTNQCPMGKGAAFRLMPHDITFSKPASITFHYDREDINGSAPELMRIAYQDEKGIWQSQPLKTLDTATHQAVVETTHFSDWALFQTMCIYPNSSILSPGENVRLRALQVIKIGEGDWTGPIYGPERVPDKQIDKWALNGEGVLTYEESIGDYLAPDWIPATNPAAVSVFLKISVNNNGTTFNDIRLVSNQFVAPEGLSVQLDDGDWHTYAGGANINGTQNIIQGRDGAEFATVTWKGAPTGTFHWTKGTDVTFNLNKPKLIYQHIYGTAASVSGGSLMVDNTDKTWVTGMFTVLPAGYVDVRKGNPELGISSVKGVFRVKRVN